MESKELQRQRIKYLVESATVIDPEHSALCNRARYIKRLAPWIVPFIFVTLAITAAHAVIPH
jgi:hypothetical protein